MYYNKREPKSCRIFTVSESHRKSLIQHCEWSELRLHFLSDKSSLKRPKMVHLKTWKFRSESVTRFFKWDILCDFQTLWCIFPIFPTSMEFSIIESGQPGADNGAIWILALKIVSFIANKSMWSVPNVFIVNMTISDLMMTCLNCSFNYIYMRDRIWYYNQLACTINNFTAILTVSASVLNMSALSINR